MNRTPENSAPSTTPHKSTVLESRRAKTLAFDTGGGVAGRAAGAGAVSDMGEEATGRPRSKASPARAFHGDWQHRILTRTARQMVSGVHHPTTPKMAQERA